MGAPHITHVIAVMRARPGAHSRASLPKKDRLAPISTGAAAHGRQGTEHVAAALGPLLHISDHGLGLI